MSDRTEPAVANEPAASSATPAPARTRVFFLDTLRGLLIIVMVLYHLLFDLVWVFGADWATPLYEFFNTFIIYDTAGFVLLAGLTSRFSRQPAAHGARLLMIAACFSLVTAFVFPGEAIYFGVLHLISVSMLVVSVVSKPFDRLPWWLCALLCAAVFAVTYHVPDGYLGFDGLLSIPVPAELTAGDLLYPFGFVGGGYAAVDYLPLLPWLFLYLLGASLGRIFTRELPPVLYRDPCPPLSAVGRYSLAIYVAHQPLIFAVLWLIYR